MANTITSAQQIPIKDRKEYLKLDDKEKKHWVLYSPSSASEDYNKLVDQTKALQQNLTDMEKIYEQMKTDPMMIKTSQMSAITVCFKLLIDALTPILKLVNDTVVGVLVKPLVEFLKALLKVLGAIVTLICATMKSAWLNGKAVVDDISQIDASGIFVENTKKILGGGDYPSIEDTANDIDWDMVAMKKQEVQTLKQDIKLQKKNYEATDAYKKMLKARQGELLQSSIDKLCDTLMKPWEEVLGDGIMKYFKVDKEYLDSIVPNPALSANKISKTLNKMAEHKYIQEKDLAGIKIYAEAKKDIKQSNAETTEYWDKKKEEVKEELDDGEITKEQYDSLIASIDKSMASEQKALKALHDMSLADAKQTMLEYFNMTNQKYDDLMKEDQKID